MLADIELIHMIRKGRLAIEGTDAISFSDRFSTLADIVLDTENAHRYSQKFRPLINNANEPSHFTRTMTGPATDAL